MVERAVGPALAEVTQIEVDGLVSVFSPVTEKVVLLNDTATDVWHLCDGEHDVAGIVRLLATAYGVDPAVIEQDVLTTVRSFVESGLIPDPGSDG
jgi:hypothetical protein